MEIEALNEINENLTIIKWSLIALSVLIIGLFVGVLVFIKTMTGLANDGALSGRVFQAEASNLLDSGEYEELKLISKERLTKYSKDKWALYYLGISQLRLKDFVDAKINLSKVREIDPSWEDSVIAYIDEADENIKLTSVE